MLESLQFEAPVINAEGLRWLLFGKSQERSLAVHYVSATRIRLDIPNMSIPAFDATLDVGDDGNWEKIGITDTEGKVTLQLAAGKTKRLEIKLDKSALPLVASPVFDDLTASGTFDSRRVHIEKFEAFSHGGTLKGNAMLQWAEGASLDGEVTSNSINMTRILPGLMENGRLDGKASFALPLDSKVPPRLNGSFFIDKGTLSGIDFGRWLKGESGGETKFNKLSGNIMQQKDRIQLTQLSGDAGKLTVKGSAAIDEQGKVNGHFSVDLNLGVERRHADAILSGPFKTPFKELKWDRR